MSYNNSHSAMMGEISEYLTKVCNNAYQKGRADAFDEFVIKYKEFQDIPCDNASCCDGECLNCFVEWYKEQKNETT